jgi:hypothetical protein
VPQGEFLRDKPVGSELCGVEVGEGIGLAPRAIPPAELDLLALINNPTRAFYAVNLFVANWQICATFMPESEVRKMQFQPIVVTPSAAGTNAITDEEAGALARTTVNLFKVWNLADVEACILLGGMSPRTWARWKEGGIGRIDRDLRMRMAHLMGIHKGLRYLFREPVRGYAWIRKSSTAFGGQSALDLMLRGEMSDLSAVREWIDAERGAW